MPQKEEPVSYSPCPHCKRVVESTWKACPYCGQSLASGRTFAEICPHCKRVIDPEWKKCPYCGKNPAQLPPADASIEIEEPPSAAWYLVPLLFGIIGGLIAYVGIRDRSSKMATDLLVFSIVWSFILALMGWAVVNSLLH